IGTTNEVSCALILAFMWFSWVRRPCDATTVPRHPCELEHGRAVRLSSGRPRSAADPSRAVPIDRRSTNGRTRREDPRVPWLWPCSLQSRARVSTSRHPLMPEHTFHERTAQFFVG